jgi:hypothetical protein
VDRQRVEAIERAIELDEPSNPARRARLLALQAQELSWEPEFAHREALAQEAITLARDAGDKRALAEVLQNASRGLWTAETLELRSALADELAGLATDLRDPAVEMAAQEFTHHVCVERGELARARDAIERWKVAAEELAQPTLRWLVAYIFAGLELLHGRLAIGERLSEQAFQIAQDAGQADAALIYGGQLALIRSMQGRGQEIIEMLEQSVSAYPGIATWRAGLASVSCLLDREDDAVSILEQAASDRFEHVTPNVSSLTTLALYADAAAYTRNIEAASALHGRMDSLSDQFVTLTTGGYGHVRLYLGLLSDVLGDDERADEHLAFACEFHDANDIPLWAARTHLGWAEALTHRGDAPGAREHATQALELSQEHGYGAFESRAAALLAAQSVAET